MYNLQSGFNLYLVIMYIETRIELETTRLGFQFQLIHLTITKHACCKTMVSGNLLCEALF